MATDLKLASFSDRELLHMLNDAADNDGWVESENLISRLGISGNGKVHDAYVKHVKQCIGVRMGWIKRLTGCVESHPEETGRWRLTETGKRVVQARLTTSGRQVIDMADDYEKLSLIALLGQRYVRADVNAANLMRREWAYGTHRNRRA